MPVPIPIPIPLPDPAPTPAPGGAEEGRALPYWLGATEPWAIAQLTSSHLEVLYRLGELAMFVLMWRPADLLVGLVSPCVVCEAQDARAFAAYEQPTKRRCPSCLGTTFDGGYRARIVRPTLWVDRTRDSSDGARGEVVTSYVSLETTRDFTLHTGDYIFRLGGDRFRCAELDAPPVRTGFDTPDPLQRVAGIVDRVTLEDPSSVAYLIPPAPEDVEVALTASSHLVSVASSPYEVVRGPLVVST